MMQFRYEARTERGELTAGVISANSLDEAGRMLSGRGQYVTKLAPDEEGGTRTGKKSAFDLFKPRVRRREVMWFISQLAVMVEAGVPLSDALEGLSRQNLSSAFQAVIADIVQSVQEGRPLSDAMKLHPQAFPPIITSLVQASEMSGTMSLILRRIAAYLIKQDQIHKRVRGALIYPGVMFVVCIGVMVFLLTVIMPKFEAIFEEKGGALPASTRFLLDTSNLVTSYWPLWIGGVAALVMSWFLWRGSRAGKRQWDWLILQVPPINGLLLKAYQGQAYATMSTLLAAGVPLLDAIEMTRQGSSNVQFAQVWAKVADSVRHGGQLSSPLFDTPFVAEPVAQMIESGERAGRLNLVFQRVGEFIEEEYEEAARNLTQLVEPAMIIIMGSFVGFVAISLMLPIFSAANVVSGK